MPLYEHIFMARQDVTSQQVEAMVDQYKGVIEQNGGKVEKTEMWGVKSLAFRIKKNRKAHFTLFNVDAPAAAVAEMERQMRINEDILRFMTIRVDELETEPSVMMQKRDRDERKDRERRDRDGGGSAAKARRLDHGVWCWWCGAGGGGRRPFFRRRKTCPFSGANAPKIDYKDTKLLSRYISERGKIVPVAHHGGVGQEAARARPGDQARPLPRASALRDPLSIRAAPSPAEPIHQSPGGETPPGQLGPNP